VNIPAASLTSHQAPALLVDVLLVTTADGGRTRLRALPMDVLQLSEACAQSVAVVMGATLRAQNGGLASGMVVGLKDAVLLRPADPATPAEVVVARLLDLPPFSIHAATAHDAQGVFFSAEVKTMMSPATASNAATSATTPPHFSI